MAPTRSLSPASLTYVRARPTPPQSWVIAEADARRVPMALLSKLFSVATFTNAGTAVIAGMVGHMAVEVRATPPATTPAQISRQPSSVPPRRRTEPRPLALSLSRR